MNKNNQIESELSSLYLQFLNRKPSKEEINSWSNQINSGEIILEDLSGMISGSLEAYRLRLKQNLETEQTDKIILDDHIFYLNSDDSIMIETYALSDNYDAGTTLLLKKLLKKEMNVINIGANMGYYTLLSAREVGSSGKVWSFEPSSSTAELLQKNILVNNYHNVEVITMAVSNKTGSAVLSIGGSSLHNIISAKEIPQMRKIEILITTIDDFMSDKSFQIDFIIMDAEGHEKYILDGLSNTLQKNPNMEIIAEYNPYTLELAGTHPEQFLNTIHELGYFIYLIDELNLSVKKINKDDLINQIRYPNVANIYLTKKPNFEFNNSS